MQGWKLWNMARQERQPVVEFYARMEVVEHGKAGKTDSGRIPCKDGSCGTWQGRRDRQW